MAKKINFLSSNCIFVSGALIGFIFFLTFYYFSSSLDSSNQQPNSLSQHLYNDDDPSSSTPSYEDDDPTSLSYTILDLPIKNWDDKRRQWKLRHSSLPQKKNTIFMITGSQPGPCPNPVGDHLLLRFYKNKADYCRLHGIELLYNNALLHPKMSSFWAKIPVIRSAMLSHPEAEWIWWVDLDAVFTDMETVLPLEKYEDYNLILEGNPKEVFEDRSWVGLNAGVFLMRNCQWSLDFIDSWARMGPQSPEFEEWGRTQKSLLKDKMFPASDDQSGIIYLLVEEKDKWADRIYLEHQFQFQGYWVPIVEKLKISLSSSSKTNSVDMRKFRRLRKRKRRAERKSTPLTPLITHFTGCQPCSGSHNEMYTWESCLEGMEMALNYADDQVLRDYGFRHDSLVKSDHGSVKPLPFHLPA